MSDDFRLRVSNAVMNLGDILTQAAVRHPDQAGLIHGDEMLAWNQLNGRVDQGARALQRAGVGKGDCVLVHSRNSPDMFESMFAVFKLGAIWVPTNFRIHPSDVEHMVELSRAKLVIYDSAFPDHADAALRAGCTRAICFGDPRPGEVTYASLRDAEEVTPFRAARVDRDDPCWLFFTSGTTGKPKASVLSHGQMGFVVNNHLADLMPGLTEEDVSLVVAPLSHGSGVNQLIVTTRCVPTVLPEGHGFDPERLFQLIEQHRVSNMFTVPTILHDLAMHEAVDRYDHSSLRYVIYAGAPMPRGHQKHAIEKFGPCLVQYFGLGEVTGNITVLPNRLHSADDREMLVGSCGYSRTGMQIEIQSDAGDPLPAGETGEICVIGPAVFNGYYRNRGANAEAFRDGWFRTGDLGYLDDRGFLFITGRKSDMFISGGSNIYPFEIEEKIAELPQVSEVCVLGMPDDKWGEIGVAAVALNPGASLDHEGLKAELSDKIAPYKIPKKLVVLPELPRSGYGKITKELVRSVIQNTGSGDG